MAKLLDELIKYTNPDPVFKDPEDNSDDDTAAKIVDYDGDDALDIAEPSSLRQKTAIILADTDKKYAGKRTSRKTLDKYSESDSDAESDEQSEDGDESDDDEVDEEKDRASTDEDESDLVKDLKEEDEDEDDTVDDEEFRAKFSKIGTKEFEFEDDGDYYKYADDSSGMEDNDERDEEEEDSDIEDDDDDVDDDNDSDDAEDDNDDSGKGDDEDISEVGDDDDGIQKFSKAATDEVAKGQAAKQQLGLWDALLEGRIKLQKAVALVNQLPQKETWKDYSDSSEAFEEKAEKAQQVLMHLLGSLVHLQNLLLHQNIETRSIVADVKEKKMKQKEEKPKLDDDEEITSDSDVDMETEKKKLTPVSIKRKRKWKMEEYPVFLKKRHKGFQEYRNTTIQKWFDKTRLAAGHVKGKSFSAFDQSAIVQINQILGDKERLLKRTQLKRSVYRVLGTQPKLGESEQAPAEEIEENLAERDHLKDYDEEIFDDDDFYHQLLRELIEKKTSDVNDPVALSRQWLEIQKLRSKTKHKVDTKASKGRKVRYDVHKKLVNFMPPMDRSEWSQEASDDLFKSLFGKRFSMANQV